MSPPRGEASAARLAEQALTSVDAGIAMMDQVRVWEHGPDISWRLIAVVQQGAPIAHKPEILVPWALSIIEDDLDAALVAKRWDLRLGCALSVLVAVLRQAESGPAARERVRPHIAAIARWFMQGVPGRHVELAAIALDVLAELPWLEGAIRDAVLQAATEPGKLPKPAAGSKPKITLIAQVSAMIAALVAVHPKQLPEAELVACIGAWAQSKKHRNSLHQVAPFLARLPTAALRQAAVVAAIVDGRALDLCTRGVVEQQVDADFLLPTIDVALKAKKDEWRSAALTALERLSQVGNEQAKERLVACLKSRSSSVREHAETILTRLGQ